MNAHSLYPEKFNAFLSQKINSVLMHPKFFVCFIGGNCINSYFNIIFLIFNLYERIIYIAAVNNITKVIKKMSL